MLKVFQKIRRKLITEGNLSKYLLYSIGEIVLIVVGILLALQINNSNEKNKTCLKEKTILLEIKESLNANMDYFDNQIKKEKSIVNSFNIIHRNIKARKPYNDSLSKHFFPLCWHDEFSFESSAYKTLQSIGFDIISSKSIKKSIINLYDINYSKLENSIRDVGRADLISLINPIFLEHFYFEDPKNPVPVDYENLQNNASFTNFLTLRIAWKTNYIQELENLKNETKVVQEMIGNEM